MELTLCRVVESSCLPTHNIVPHISWHDLPYSWSVRASPLLAVCGSGRVRRQSIPITTRPKPTRHSKKKTPQKPQDAHKNSNAANPKLKSAKGPGKSGWKPSASLCQPIVKRDGAIIHCATGCPRTCQSHTSQRSRGPPHSACSQRHASTWNQRRERETSPKLTLPAWIRNGPETPLPAKRCCFVRPSILNEATSFASFTQQWMSSASPVVSV